MRYKIRVSNDLGVISECVIETDDIQLFVRCWNLSVFPKSLNAEVIEMEPAGPDAIMKEKS